MFLQSEWRPNKMSLSSLSKLFNYIFWQELPISRNNSFLLLGSEKLQESSGVRKLRRAFHVDHGELCFQLFSHKPKGRTSPSYILNLWNREQEQSWCAFKGYTVHHLPRGLGCLLLWILQLSYSHSLWPDSVTVSYSVSDVWASWVVWIVRS